MVSRPVIKKQPVAVSRIIDIGAKPMSEPPMSERARLTQEVRFLLSDAAVTFSYAGDFDLKKFLEGISLVKKSTQDDGLVIISQGKLYKFYVDDISPGNVPVSVNMKNRIRLDDGDQAYYLFPVGRS
jgi:hypothetical protein